MQSKSSGLARTKATIGVLLLAAASGLVSSCIKDLDALSAEYGGGAGEGGSNNRAGAGGSSASDGIIGGEAGVGGEIADGGKGGKGGGGNQTCDDGFTRCPDGPNECIDLEVGSPDGDGVENCGQCGTTCNLDQASSAKCEAGLCVPSCQTGFDDCNAATDNDGCETDVATPDHCGGCNYACNRFGAASQECVSKHCAPTCGSYYADCNSSTVDRANDDGCERYLDSLVECTIGCDNPRVACDPLQVCNDGLCVAPSGLVALSVPFTDSTQKHRFADLFIPVPDLEGSTLTVRAYAPGATGGSLFITLSDTASNPSVAMIYTELTSISQKWMDITIPIVSQNTFNATLVKQINLELHALAGPWINPTVVYIDSIRSSNLLINDTFDSSVGNMVTSSILVVPGSTFSWVQSVP